MPPGAARTATMALGPARTATMALGPARTATMAPGPARTATLALGPAADFLTVYSQKEKMNHWLNSRLSAMVKGVSKFR